ncbi:hypothetical protein ONZ45_g7663 [Pleurotus djamor]|nr:hypothetical protein ONZ45_g7663 [Pleurotus djamor]
MGQRHQVFLIAKVIPHGPLDAKPNYRSLGGYHHQWCYGRLPLKATRRFINLVSQKDNAEVIQLELDDIQGKYHKLNGVNPAFPKIPCPYLMSILAMAWDFDLDDERSPYISGRSVEHSIVPSNCGSFSQDNNDGITVIDVSDLSNPSCCHVVRDRPISAEQYVRRHFGGLLSRDEANDAQMVISALDNIPLITLEVLAEVWPHEYMKSTSAAPLGTEVLTEIHASNPSLRGVPQLSEITIDLAIRQSIDDEDFSAIEKLIWMPGRADQILSALSQQDKFSDGALSLVAKVLDVDPDRDTVNLSGWKLASEQIKSLFSGSVGVKSVNLSKMPNVTIDCVRGILTAIPTISCLNLLGTPISNEDMVGLLSTEPKLFYHMDVLLHKVFLSFHEHAPYDAAFWFPAPASVMAGGASSAIPYFTPQRIVQTFTDYLSPFAGQPMMMSLSSAYLGLLGLACMSYGPRPEGQKWGERFISILPTDEPRLGMRTTYVLATTEMSKRSYAFVRIVQNNGSPVLDPDFRKEARDFFKFLVDEGRPAPTAASVDKLVDLIDKVGYKLMGDAELEEFKRMMVWYVNNSES